MTSRHGRAGRHGAVSVRPGRGEGAPAVPRSRAIRVYSLQVYTMDHNGPYKQGRDGMVCTTWFRTRWAHQQGTRHHMHQHHSVQPHGFSTTPDKTIQCGTQWYGQASSHHLAQHQQVYKGPATTWTSTTRSSLVGWHTLGWTTMVWNHHGGGPVGPPHQGRDYMVCTTVVHWTTVV